MTQEIEIDQRKRKIEALFQERERAKMLNAFQQILEFNKTPQEIKAFFDKYIVGQEEAKKVMATAIAFHYRRLGQAIKKELEGNDGKLELALKNTTTPKANILLIGPSGCGKTYTAEKAAQFVNVPFVKEDMTKFSETGYVGRDLSEIAIDLLTEAKENPFLANVGIVYLDEIDKIAAAPVIGRDVSGLGVQNGLLKLVEGAENLIQTALGNIPFSTKHVLFIASGAFEGLDIIVKSRLERQKVKLDGKHWQDYLLTCDLVSYGMSRQLMGRFPVRVFYNQLTKDDLVSIMEKSEDSPLKAYINDFKAWDIELSFTKDALEEIAKAAEAEGTGARGLTGILNKVLLDDMYSLPGNYKGKLQIDKEYVNKKLKNGN
jgi:ATP-dependent Clp protease ATP-binding subunit ClpX